MSATSPKSRENFSNFANTFNKVDSDWEGMIDLFAPEAQLKYVFAGFPVVEGDRNKANADFKPVLKMFRCQWNYLSGSDTDCIYECSAYYETVQGNGAVYTCYGYLEFNDEGKVVKKVAYSNNSEQVAKNVIAAVEQITQEN